ncbi:MAG: type II secretion system protein GspM [Candidatus Omnitrophica bacterium]|nr:type II secretion system protein GspM [Candidatus Omnitrophota bacterium]
MPKFRPNNLMIAAVVILLILYQFVCLPNIRKIRSVNRVIEQKRKDFQTLTSLAAEYKERTAEEKVVLAPPEFNLYLFISKAAETIGSKSRISRITPVTENILLKTVEQHISIAFEEIELEKLLMLLDEIEKRDFLRFGYLQISRNPQKPFVVKSEMELVSYKKPQSE